MDVDHSRDYLAFELNCSQTALIIYTMNYCINSTDDDLIKFNLKHLQDKEKQTKSSSSIFSCHFIIIPESSLDSIKSKLFSPDNNEKDPIEVSLNSQTVELI